MLGLKVVRPQCLPSKDLVLHHIQAADTVSSVIYNLNRLKIPRSGIPAANSAIYGPLEEKQHPLQSIIKLNKVPAIVTSRECKMLSSAFNPFPERAVPLNIFLKKKKKKDWHIKEVDIKNYHRQSIIEQLKRNNMW